MGFMHFPATPPSSVIEPTRLTADHVLDTNVKVPAKGTREAGQLTSAEQNASTKWLHLQHSIR